MLILRWLAKPLWVTLFGLRIVRLRVTGREHLKGLGACIFAPKHRDGADGAVLEMALPFPIIFVIRDDYGPRFLRTLVASVIRVMWINRGHLKKSQYERIVELLRDGEHLVIFLEGTRSPILQRGEETVVALACKRHVPVVPISINGTDNFLRKGFILEILKRIFRLVPPIEVIIHKPTMIQADGRNYRALTDQVMLTIATGTPHHQRGIYGGSVVTT